MMIRNAFNISSVLGLLMLLGGCATKPATETERDRAFYENEIAASGRLEQAMAETPGLNLFPGKDGEIPPRWEEQLDRGDDPLTPGCACRRALPNCGGRTVGRAVDECFPDDGVSLHEKTITQACDTYSGKRYNCEELLGEGATCRLQPMTCCGVATSSAYCHIDIEG